MREYELMFIVAQRDIKEGTHEAKVEEIRALVEKLEGRVLRVRPWGLRELAYDIGGFDYGYYVIMQVLIGEEKAAEFETRLKSIEKVLRFIMLKTGDREGGDIDVFADMAGDDELKKMTKSGTSDEVAEVAPVVAAEATAQETVTAE